MFKHYEGRLKEIGIDCSIEYEFEDDETILVAITDIYRNELELKVHESMISAFDGKVRLFAYGEKEDCYYVVHPELYGKSIIIHKEEVHDVW
jgi:hypothetical protein